MVSEINNKDEIIFSILAEGGFLSNWPSDHIHNPLGVRRQQTRIRPPS